MFNRIITYSTIFESFCFCSLLGTCCNYTPKTPAVVLSSRLAACCLAKFWQMVLSSSPQDMHSVATVDMAFSKDFTLDPTFKSLHFQDHKMLLLCNESNKILPYSIEHFFM